MDENTYVEIERYAQRVEIDIKDIAEFTKILMKNGYEVRMRQDGASMDIAMIEFIDPEFTGHHFEETEY